MKEYLVILFLSNTYSVKGMLTIFMILYDGV